MSGGMQKHSCMPHLDYLTVYSWGIMRVVPRVSLHAALFNSIISMSCLPTNNRWAKSWRHGLRGRLLCQRLRKGNTGLSSIYFICFQIVTQDEVRDNHSCLSKKTWKYNATLSPAEPLVPAGPGAWDSFLVWPSSCKVWSTDDLRRKQRPTGSASNHRAPIALNDIQWNTTWWYCGNPVRQKIPLLSLQNQNHDKIIMFIMFVAIYFLLIWSHA